MFFEKGIDSYIGGMHSNPPNEWTVEAKGENRKKGKLRNESLHCSVTDWMHQANSMNSN